MSILTRSASLFGLIALLVVGGVSGCSSSSGPVVGRDVERRVYLVKGQSVDQAPQIVGGYAAVEREKSYPKAAENDKAYGVIWLQATISAGGTATRVQLAEGGHPALETEALNVVQRLRFHPAQINGAPVQSQVQLPVIFQGPYAKPKKKKEEKQG
ncbi:MAG: hypothetical protein BRD55_11355 [Bacteroidetes bacterium SW_9_63_38]|nr:MAG: hypothetical protein BRD55_11355 [Bacteroidetes bacterium SW_9_63_38]